jgi:hypothetical protein
MRLSNMPKATAEDAPRAFFFEAGGAGASVEMLGLSDCCLSAGADVSLFLDGIRMRTCKIFGLLSLEVNNCYEFNFTDLRLSSNRSFC